MTDLQPEPWDSPGPLFDDVTWCDACGEPTTADSRHAIAALPCDVAAANAGESATLCRTCYLQVQTIGGAA